MMWSQRCENRPSQRDEKGEFQGRQEVVVVKTLMVVDDEDLIRESAAHILEKAGYTVIEAVDGLDALNKLDGSEVDMVITDFRMPKMNGVEFIRELRTLPAYKYLPIVVMTADVEEFERRVGEKALVSGLISKPFLRRQLTDAVKKSTMQEG
jgi:two-component system, chemotaxis family, chemotaxis protein CheY